MRLTNPQVDKRKQAYELSDPFIALGVVRETSDGIIVRGARMLATLPISDEILIFPSTVVKGGDEMKPYALAFGIPNNTPGLSFQCREPLDLGRSHRDHPLGSRFDEMDAMVYFDDVLVPWERVLLMNDVDLANRAYAETGAVLHMAHQVVNLKIAKTEAFLGVIQAVDRHDRLRRCAARAAHGRRGDHDPRDHEGPEDRQRGRRHAEQVRRDDAGTTAARRGAQLVPRRVQAARRDHATGDDQRSDHDPDRGRLRRATRRRHRQVPARRGGSAEERVALFRLAWDMSISAFGGRQSHYELFFFGDPPRMKQALYGMYDRSECVERVNAFVADTGWPQTR